MSDDGTEAEVVVVEPTGAEVQIFARLDGQQITAVLRERLMLKPGEKVQARARRGRSCMFSTKQSGKRL